MTMECRVAVESNDLYNGMSVEYQMKQKMVREQSKVKSQSIQGFSIKLPRIPLSCAIIILLV